MNARIKNYLKGNYSLYNCYLYFFNKPHLAYRKKERDFYGLFVKPGRLVFDIGANIGDKTGTFGQLDAHIIAVEPDPNNCRLIKQQFGNNSRIHLVQAAVSDRIGVSKFYIQTPGSAYNTLSDKWKDILEEGDGSLRDKMHFTDSIEVDTVTLDTLIDKYNTPHYIKIDVEGYELPVIKGLTKKINIISFEANLPEFRSETLQILEHLHRIDPEVRFNYSLSDYVLHYREAVPFKSFVEFFNTSNYRYMEIYCFMNGYTVAGK